MLQYLSNHLSGNVLQSVDEFVVLNEEVGTGCRNIPVKSRTPRVTDAMAVDGEVLLGPGDNA